MRKLSAYLSLPIALVLGLSGCSKSAEDIAFEEKLKVAELIYAEKSTWDILGTINVTNCLARTVGDTSVLLWSTETAECNGNIRRVVAVVARLDPEIQAVKSQDDVLLSKTRSQFSVAKTINLCDQLEWISPTTQDGCLDKLIDASALAGLQSTINSWYSFRANPEK